MIRGLNYSIRFGENDEFMLTRDMTQVADPNEGLQEEYVIEDERQGVRLTPAELAELHDAIHEMERMSATLHKALAEGEGCRVGMSSPAALSSERLGILRMMAKGSALIRDVFPHDTFEYLLDQELIAVSRSADHNCPTEFSIAPAGRAALEAADV